LNPFDRYFGRRFLAFEALILGSILAIFVFARGREGWFGETGDSGSAAAIFAGAYFLTPLSGWAAMVCAVFSLRRHNELSAFSLSGRSPLRTVAGPAVLAAAVGAAFLGIRETAFPFGDRGLASPRLRASGGGILHRKDWVFLYGGVDRDPPALRDVVCVRHAEGTIREAIFADRLRWRGEEAELTGASRWTEDEDRVWRLDPAPPDPASLPGAPRTFSPRHWALSTAADIASWRSEDRESPGLRVAWHELWAYPFLHPLFVLLAAVSVIRSGPPAAIGGLLRSLAVGAGFFGAAFYARELALAGWIPPEVSVWGTIAVPGALAVMGLLRGR
jgi:lipopolysaccharide export LptBFGC system permease protein LptF